MKIEREAFSAELFAELMPLAQKCWEESTATKLETCAYHGERDFKVEPDRETYQKFAESGALVVITLRLEGALKGYVVGFLYHSWHHKKTLCGNGDSIYVEPAFRTYAPIMVERFEREMKEAGAAIIGWPTHMSGPVYKFLKARGYVGDDILMEKRLCV